jgi:hypothetical protein
VTIKQILREIIKTRDKDRCQRCGGLGTDTSHFIGSWNEATRWELLNSEWLCRECHNYFDREDRKAYREFKIAKYGLEAIEALELRSRQHYKKDRERDKEKLLNLLNKLNEIR